MIGYTNTTATTLRTFCQFFSTICPEREVHVASTNKNKAYNK